VEVGWEFLCQQGRPSQLQASMLAVRLTRPNLPQASIRKNGLYKA